VQGGSPMNLSLMDSSERQDSVNGLDSESIIEQQQQQQSTKQHETEASSLIKLDNGDVLYMREVNRYINNHVIRFLFLISYCIDF
jgi:Ras-related GTP-binding protein C/D